MSPEQALAKRVPVDHRTDIYSLGVTLYELLTLRPAYDGGDRQEILQQIAFEEPRLLRRVNKAIPSELEIIVRKAMGKTPAERYATAQELADDLRRFLDEKPIRAKRPTLLDWTRKWARRHQGMVTTGICGLIVAVMILLVSMFLLLSAYQSEANEKKRTVTVLYRSLVREAEAIRRARGEGYRSNAWRLLQEAQQLETPVKDPNQLCQEALACMGDSVGLAPVIWSDFPGKVNAISLHPNGGLLAIGLDDGTVLLRDIRTGQALAPLKPQASPVTALAFAPDGAELVSGYGNGTIHVWLAKADGEWRLARTILGQPKVAALIPTAAFPFFVPHLVLPSVNSIALTPDSKQLAASLFYILGTHSSLPFTIARWSVGDGTQTSWLESSHALEQISNPAFSPDGQLMSVCYLRYVGHEPSLQVQHGILVWDLNQRGEPLDLSLNLGIVHQTIFSPDGKLLACACDEGLALLDTGTYQWQAFPQAERTWSVAFSPDSHLLAITNGLLGQVRLWNVTNHRETAVLPHPGMFKDAVHSVACSRDALVTASPRAVRIWNLAGSGEKLLLAGHARGTNTLSFSPDGKLLASGGKDMAVKIWDAATGQLLQNLSGFGGEVEAVAFSADGKVLATGDWAGSIQFWDISTGKPLPSPLDHGLGQWIWSVAFSPDGRCFAAAGGARGVALWRIQGGGTNQEAGARITFQRLPGPVCTRAGFLTFSPDSQLLAWTDCDSAVHLWDLRACQEIPFSAHAAGFFKCLAFSPGGKQILFVSGGVPEAWDVSTGRKAFPFVQAQSPER
jgi:WD40 repeat protein